MVLRYGPGLLGPLTELERCRPGYLTWQRVLAGRYQGTHHNLYRDEYRSVVGSGEERTGGGVYYKTTVKWLLKSPCRTMDDRLDCSTTSGLS